jgi:protein-S-isoprenylcysteine O-methyltransferase Ste14
MDMNQFQIYGFLVILLFYGSYFGKMFLQRSQGIHTDRMGKGKKSTQTRGIEIILKIATYSMAVTQVASVFLIDSRYYLIQLTKVRFIGLLIAFLGVLTFIIAMAAMKNNWRAGIDASQKTDLVQKGIYRLSRNPAFLGFDLFYIGFTLCFGSILQIAVMCFAVVMLHLQILEEEKYLPSVFGEAYLEYKKSTGRYFWVL